MKVLLSEILASGSPDFRKPPRCTEFTAVYNTYWAHCSWELVACLIDVQDSLWCVLAAIVSIWLQGGHRGSTRSMKRHSSLSLRPIMALTWVLSSAAQMGSSHHASAAWHLQCLHSYQIRDEHNPASYTHASHHMLSFGPIAHCLSQLLQLPTGNQRSYLVYAHKGTFF